MTFSPEKITEKPNIPERTEGKITDQIEIGKDWESIANELLFSEDYIPPSERNDAKSEPFYETSSIRTLIDYLDILVYSTPKERLDRTPREDSDRGVWTGERGDSDFIPNDKEIIEILDKYGLDGITYKDGIPDFSECSESTVEIDNMTDKRYGSDGNFAQCDEKCADQWNKEARDGKTDWTARDVRNWREENNYTWHERNDMKTCDLVPTKINDYFGHLGGVSEYKKLHSQDNGGEFDE